MTIEEAIKVLKELKRTISNDWSESGNKIQLALLIAIESLENLLH